MVLLDDIYLALSPELMQGLLRELMSLFSLAGLEVRKWSFNDEQLLVSFPKDHFENTLAFFDETSGIKILGLQL